MRARAAIAPQTRTLCQPDLGVARPDHHDHGVQDGDGATDSDGATLGTADPDGAAETLGAAEADGATDPDGDAKALLDGEADALLDGATDTDGAGVGVGEPVIVPPFPASIA